LLRKPSSPGVSLTRQAVQLGFAPRASIIVHTSSREIGQIYIPGANWGLMVGTLALVLVFQNSSNLAAAYGVAVTTTMIHHHVARLCGLATPVEVEAAGGARGNRRIPGGRPGVLRRQHPSRSCRAAGFPLLVGVGGFLLFTTWQKGRELLAAEMNKTTLPLTTFVQDLQAQPITHRSPALQSSDSSPHGTPVALLHNLKLNPDRAPGECCGDGSDRGDPLRPKAERLEVRPLGAGFSRLIVRYGFMEDPRSSSALAARPRRGHAD